MIRTYTPTDELHLPGDVGGLLDGYCGPVDLNTDNGIGYKWCQGIWQGAATAAFDGLGRIHDMRDTTQVRLPLNRPEALYRALCWLNEGKRCPECLGRGTLPGVTDDGLAPSSFGCRGCSGDGSRGARGTGYLRAPAQLWWALSPGPSTLPAWVCRAVVHASVLRVSAGMEAVRTVGRPSRNSPEHGRPRGVLPFDDVLIDAHGLVIVDIHFALASGYALLDGDTLTEEVPDV